MALKLQTLTNDLLDSYDVLPLGTKGEVAAFVAAFLMSGETASQVIAGITAAQVSALKKALVDQGASETHMIETLSQVTGSRTYTVNRTKKDGSALSYDVTKDVRERFGVFIRSIDATV